MRKSFVVLSSLLALCGSLLAMPAASAAVVTINVSTVSVDIGVPFKVSGKATNQQVGDPVKIQVQRPGSTRWVTVKTVLLKAKRTYATRIKLSAVGDNKVRVKSARLASPYLTVTAYTWLDLTAQGHIAVTDVHYMGTTVQMGGKSYPRSIYAFDSGYWIWSVQRCTAVKMALGRAEDFLTPTGSYSMTIDTYKDGVLTPGLTYPVDAGPYAITKLLPAGTDGFSITVAGFTGEVDAGLGTPRIRCAVPALTMNPDDFNL